MMTWRFEQEESDLKDILVLVRALVSVAAAEAGSATGFSVSTNAKRRIIP